MIPMIENIVTIWMEVMFFGLLILVCVAVLLYKVISTKFWKDRCPSCKQRAGRYTMYEDNTIRCRNCCADLNP